MRFTKQNWTLGTNWSLNLEHEALSKFIWWQQLWLDVNLHRTLHQFFILHLFQHPRPHRWMRQRAESPPSTGTQRAAPFSEKDVWCQLSQCKLGKAPGPDGVSPTSLLIITTLWKAATIIQVPKEPQPTELNLYRPVALTSIIMKSWKSYTPSRQLLANNWTTSKLPTGPMGTP